VNRSGQCTELLAEMAQEITNADAAKNAAARLEERVSQEAKSLAKVVEDEQGSRSGHQDSFDGPRKCVAGVSCLLLINGRAGRNTKESKRSALRS
jgi:hypothetical protein